MWELTPKSDRPEAQVLLTLPNGEREYVDGFCYQEFRLSGAEEHPALSPAGPPHTRYRYLPRLAGTHMWELRTPAGGILEQGAFVTERVTAPLPPPAPDAPCDTLRLPGPEEEPAGLIVTGSLLDRLGRGGCARLLALAGDDRVARAGGVDPPLGWCLDRLLRAGQQHAVPVLLQVAGMATMEPSRLHAWLHAWVCRFAAMPGLAAWEVAASGETAQTAMQILRSYDPRRPVRLAGEDAAAPPRPEGIL